MEGKNIVTGSYGEVVYAIRGFGSEKFSVEPTTGLITVAACGRRGTACLDYETQKTFSLIYTATDGGGQVRKQIRRKNDKKSSIEVY